MIIEINKRIYPIEQVMRAAYVFTEQAYIYLDEKDERILVSLEPKSGFCIDKIQGEFKNELLAQVLRKSINERTGNIRELIYQRAMSSSIILNENGYSESQAEPNNTFDLEDILIDWFDRGKEDD